MGFQSEPVQHYTVPIDWLEECEVQCPVFPHNRDYAIFMSFCPNCDSAWSRSPVGLGTFRKFCLAITRQYYSSHSYTLHLAWTRTNPSARTKDPSVARKTEADKSELERAEERAKVTMLKLLELADREYLASGAAVGRYVLLKEIQFDELHYPQMGVVLPKVLKQGGRLRVCERDSAVEQEDGVVGARAGRESGALIPVEVEFPRGREVDPPRGGGGRGVPKTPVKSGLAARREREAEKNYFQIPVHYLRLYDPQTVVAECETCGIKQIIPQPEYRAAVQKARCLVSGAKRHHTQLVVNSVSYARCEETLKVKCRVGTGVNGEAVEEMAVLADDYPEDEEDVFRIQNASLSFGEVTVGIVRDGGRILMDSSGRKPEEFVLPLEVLAPIVDFVPADFSGRIQVPGFGAPSIRDAREAVLKASKSLLRRSRPARTQVPGDEVFLLIRFLPPPTLTVILSHLPRTSLSTANCTYRDTISDAISDASLPYLLRMISPLTPAQSFF